PRDRRRRGHSCRARGRVLPDGALESPTRDANREATRGRTAEGLRSARCREARRGPPARGGGEGGDEGRGEAQSRALEGDDPGRACRRARRLQKGDARRSGGPEVM